MDAETRRARLIGSMNVRLGEQPPTPSKGMRPTAQRTRNGAGATAGGPSPAVASVLGLDLGRDVVGSWGSTSGNGRSVPGEWQPWKLLWVVRARTRMPASL